MESLETNPVFDAGIGSVLNEDGDVEMDALIMDGKDLNTGSVIGINNLEHPIRLARLIMDKTHHVAFQGAGASRLADEFGLERIPQEILVTPAAVEEWKQYKKYGKAVSSLFMNDKDKQHVHTAPGNQAHHDTVGCVALDSNGNVACGTSTGGITAKKVGRVGDSPLVGSGGYAANELGGASTTGHGESIAKVLLAQRVLNTAAHSRMSIQHAAEVGLMLHLALSFGAWTPPLLLSFVNELNRRWVYLAGIVGLHAHPCRRVWRSCEPRHGRKPRYCTHDRTHGLGTHT